MDIGIIARRYARALLLFACENGHETLVYEQAQQLLFQYNELPEFRHTIENPMVSRTEKIKLLHNATAGADTCEELTKFFYLLLEKRREKLLAFILHSFLFLYRKKKKIRQGKLVTAMPLPEEFKTKVDPGIIGGGILEIGYWRIDASIAGQLKRVKKQFIEKNRRIV